MTKKESVEKKEVVKRMTKAQIENALVENFVSLQKVLTNLSVKFDDLSNKMEKLLEIFEISAKSFSEKYQDGYSEKTGGESDAEFLKKLDSLLDQNKTIAKGIVMMEERIKNRGVQYHQFQPQFQPQPVSQEQDSDPYRNRNLQRY